MQVSSCTIWIKMFTKSEAKQALAKKIYDEASPILHTKGDDYLRINHGIKLADLPHRHSLKYHDKCPYIKSGRGHYPAIIAPLFDKSERIVGILIFNINKRTIFTIGKKPKSGVVIIGDFGVADMIITQDFITALKLSAKTKKTACAYIDNVNLYDFHPQIGKIRNIDLYVESTTHFKQLRIGSKVDTYWEGIGVRLNYKRLDTTAISFKNNQFSQKKTSENTK